MNGFAPGLITRRQMLIWASSLTAATMFTWGSADSLTKRRKVVVTGGHPGDPEYGCGGTIALLTAAGAEVSMLYLNEGEPASARPVLPKGTRVAEAQKASEILKARSLFARQVDGDAVVDRAHYDDFRKLLVAEQPDLVLTHWPIDNHADHRATFMLVYDAWLKMQKSFALYFYEVSDGEDTVQFTPTLYVDIGSVESEKRAACYAHSSQSPDRFYALQDAVARWRGTESGVARAEGFVRHIQSKEFGFPATGRTAR